MQEEKEKLETQELVIKAEFKSLNETDAELLAEENFIFCDFEDSEPVVLKVDEVEVLRAYSYSGLFKSLVKISEKEENATVTLYLVDDELQEEEAFLKVKLYQSTHVITTEPPYQESATQELYDES
jgi:hypothetical protein